VTTGGLAGAAVAAVRGAPGSRSLRRASSAMAAAMLLSFVAPTVPIALAALAGIGFAWSLFIASTVAVLQTAEPPMLGRVMSWLAVVLIGGMAAGGPLAGLVAELLGPRTPFLVGAAASLAAAAMVRPRTARPGATAGPLLEADDHRVGSDKWLHIGVTKADVGHPSATVRAGVVEAGLGLDEHVDAHE
jgi:MFS family permease